MQAIQRELEVQDSSILDRKVPVGFWLNPVKTGILVAQGGWQLVLVQTGERGAFQALRYVSRARPGERNWVYANRKR